MFNYKSKTVEQLLRYMLVGGAATLIDLSLFSILIYIYSMHYNIAIVAGFFVGVFVNFMLCNAFVFSRGKISFRNALARHYAASMAGFVINFTLFQFWQEAVVSDRPVLGRIVVAALTFVFNFFAFKRFSFLEHRV